MAVNIWLILSWVMVFVCGLLFFAFILFYTLSGTYGKEIVKAKISGKKLVWVIDNHNNVKPKAVGGEFGYKIGKIGMFFPDPDHPIKTEDVKGSLHDSNLAPAIHYDLLSASKKLSRFNIRGRSNKNGGIEAVIYDQRNSAAAEAKEIPINALNDFEEIARSADELKFAETVNEFEKKFSDIDKSITDSNLSETMKEEFKALIKTEFEECIQKIIDFRETEEYAEDLNNILISVVNTYSQQINDLSNEFKNEIMLNDPEIKALRYFYNLVQPQYFERQVVAGINDATAGQKDLTKVFIYMCGGIGILIIAIAFFVMLVGGNDPTVILQNATDAVANNTTQINV